MLKTSEYLKHPASEFESKAVKGKQIESHNITNVQENILQMSKQVIYLFF